jgi:hypothetical protein
VNAREKKKQLLVYTWKWPGVYAWEIDKNKIEFPIE